MKFLETNVFLRYLTRDDEAKARACFELFRRTERGQEELTTSETIIAEVTHVLSSPRAGYRLDHEDIRARLTPILSMRGLKLEHKRMFYRALDIYGSDPELDFEDAMAVAHVERQDLTEIVSYDRDFDRISGIHRTER